MSRINYLKLSSVVVVCAVMVLAYLGYSEGSAGIEGILCFMCCKKLAGCSLQYMKVITL